MAFFLLILFSPDNFSTLFHLLIPFPQHSRRKLCPLSIKETSSPKMPPRLAHGPAPEGPSRGRGTGAGGQKGEKPKEPRMWGKPLTEDQCDVFFYAHKVYKHEGRPLTGDEVCAVMSQSQRKQMLRYSTVKTVFDIFDDPKNPWTEKHERSVKVKAKADKLEKTVAHALKHYFSTDEREKNIAATFEGM